VDKEISITGEPTVNPAACSFTIDRPVYAGGSAYFGNRRRRNTRLLRRGSLRYPKSRIFDCRESVTVTKSGFDPWPVVGKKIGAKIREHIQSSDPAVSANYDSLMPSESEIRSKVQNLLENENQS